MPESITWVGLDVHKESVTAAIVEDQSEEVQVVKLSSDLNKVRRLFRKLSKRAAVRSCYEASGAGFVLHRVLERDGFHCDVVAPSLIPRKPGDRRKTDRLDAIQLAKLYRSGHLTSVRVPDEEQEAVRRLLRLRTTHMQQLKSAKQRIFAILYSQGLTFRGTKSLWTKKHRSWLQERVEEATGALKTCLGVELEHLEYLETQLGALDAEIERYAQHEPYRQTVECLKCLRGVKTLTAMTIASEIGNIHTFRSPRQLMSWVGLIPSEHSSGGREHRGSITKAGNGHLRRLLIEAAWNNRHRSGADLILSRRRQGQPPEVVAMAVKAQHRLSRRFWALMRRKHINVAVVAVARELCGFVWAIMRAAPRTV